MCIVIDTCTMASVFDTHNVNHKEFAPVLEWIINGHGSMIFGGRKYLQEIPRGYERLVNELSRANKAIQLKTNIVDKKQNELELLVNNEDFDDAHIIAIVIVARCKLISSLDKRAYKFFRMKSLYPNRFERPSIYSGSRNRGLLVDDNITEIGKPVFVLPKKVTQSLPL